MKNDYFAFIVCSCKTGKVEYFTNSARRARALLEKGLRVEVWNDAGKSDTIRAAEKSKFARYIEREKEYIRRKQEKAESTNRRRRCGYGKTHEKD